MKNDAALNEQIPCLAAAYHKMNEKGRETLDDLAERLAELHRDVLEVSGDEGNGQLKQNSNCERYR